MNELLGAIIIILSLSGAMYIGHLAFNLIEKMVVKS